MANTRRQCFPHFSQSQSWHTIYTHSTKDLKVCPILHNYAKGEMTCSAVIEASYKYNVLSVEYSIPLLTHSTIWVHPLKKQLLWAIAHTVCDRLMN